MGFGLGFWTLLSGSVLRVVESRVFGIWDCSAFGIGGFRVLWKLWSVFVGVEGGELNPKPETRNPKPETRNPKP